MLQDSIDHKTPSVDELMAAIPEFDQDTNMATRIAGQVVLQVSCAEVCSQALFSHSYGKHGGSLEIPRVRWDFRS